MAVFVPAFAQVEVDYNLEALFIYQFTKYIDWPDERKKGDFIIGIYGETPVYSKLKAITASKKVGEQPIRLQQLSEDGPVSQCNILFITASESVDMPRIIKKVGESSVLIVTEKKGLARRGACINFIIDDGKMKFEINKRCLENDGLKVAGELMRLAIMI